MTKKFTRTLAGAAIAAGAGATGAAADTGANHVLSSERMAEIIAVYHNDAAPKDSATDRLTEARIETVKAAFDAYMEQNVDGLSGAEMARVQQQFDQYLQGGGRTITFAKTKLSK